MAAVAIHAVPDDNFDDWVVRADIGQSIAQEREAELVVHLSDGKTSRTRFVKSWVPAMIRRNRATPCYTFMPWACSRVHASS
jgi:thymidylate synthase